MLVPQICYRRPVAPDVLPWLLQLLITMLLMVMEVLLLNHSPIGLMHVMMGLLLD